MWLGELDLLEMEPPKFLYWHDMIQATGAVLCQRTLNYWIDMTHEPTPDDKIYRVRIAPDTKQVDVVCIGMDCVDTGAEGNYASADALPSWIQNHIALLMMTSLSKPTREVKGVGRRIDADTYWVYKC